MVKGKPDECDIACALVTENSLDTVYCIETPVVSILCTLTKSELIRVLERMPATMSLKEKCLWVLLISDAVSCFIKNSNFYENYQSRFTLLLNVLHLKLEILVNSPIEDFDCEEIEYYYNIVLSARNRLANSLPKLDARFVSLLKKFRSKNNEDLNDFDISDKNNVLQPLNTILPLKEKGVRQKNKIAGNSENKELTNENIVKDESDFEEEKKNAFEALKTKNLASKKVLGNKKSSKNTKVFKATDKTSKKEEATEDVSKKKNAFELMKIKKLPNEKAPKRKNPGKEKTDNETRKQEEATENISNMENAFELTKIIKLQDEKVSKNIKPGKEETDNKTRKQEEATENISNKENAFELTTQKIIPKAHKKPKALELAKNKTSINEELSEIVSSKKINAFQLLMSNTKKQNCNRKNTKR